MKARDIVSAAFDEVVSLKTPISDAELVDGLRYLNRMMAKLEFDGVTIGYTKAGLDEDLTVPDAAILAIIKNLAVTLWKQYSSLELNPLIAFAARRGMDTLRFISTDSMPDTKNTSYLPRGSGNYERYTDPFYSNEQEADQYIGTENG